VKRSILFLCTGNSCRSQMAEGWARALLPGEVQVRSAGLEARGLDPRAVRVMAERGVDISGQRSTRVGELTGETFDLVVTVCQHAHETCPVFPGSPPVSATRSTPWLPTAGYGTRSTTSWRGGCPASSTSSRAPPAAAKDPTSPR